MSQALDLSGTECITVAVRRERLIDAAGKNLLDFIDTKRYTIPCPTRPAASTLRTPSASPAWDARSSRRWAIPAPIG